MSMSLITLYFIKKWNEGFLHYISKPWLTLFCIFKKKRSGKICIQVQDSVTGKW